MERNHAIDAFRGCAIIGMIFFTLLLRLSSDLPDLLRHNVWGTVHIGDFVLPMFLFVSGISLAYYLEKRKDNSRQVFLKEVTKRFGTLALIGLSLSFFSASGFLHMDEVMLNALLFLLCVILARFDWKILLGLICAINVSYLGLVYFNLDDIFIGYYLGGYPAALYYLPIMITGLILGKQVMTQGLWNKRNTITMGIIAILFLVFLFITPLNKMTATPSFILLSILVSYLLYVIIEWITREVTTFGQIENLGKKPLRYWIMTYVFILIPLWFYVEYTAQELPLNIFWPFAILISGGFLILLWFLTYVSEYIHVSN